MAELIDIKDERFWEILFDEACVEGQQAERIERELKAIATTEAEIRAKAIDEFAEVLQKICDDRPIGVDEKTWRPLYGHEDGTWHDLIGDVVKQLKESD